MFVCVCVCVCVYVLRVCVLCACVCVCMYYMCVSPYYAIHATQPTHELKLVMLLNLHQIN